jgi:hypothetical protein
VSCGRLALAIIAIAAQGQPICANLQFFSFFSEFMSTFERVFRLLGYTDLKKGTGAIGRDGLEGASHKQCLSPFRPPLRFFAAGN